MLGDMDAAHTTPLSVSDALSNPSSPPPTGSAASATTASPLKRACDACHKRKVKCRGDGTRACKNCVQAGLSCTYNSVPQKKGPKGSRAKIITELRQTQRQTQWTSQQVVIRERSDPGSPDSPGHPRGMPSTELAVICADFFFTHLYPTQPILHRCQVGDTIGLMESNAEAYCLVASLCAYVLIQPNMTLPTNMLLDPEDPSSSNLQLGKVLLAEARRVRKSFDHVEMPTVWAVITSFFLFGSLFGLNQHNAAWFHLREATTLAHLLGMNDEATYAQLPDTMEVARRRRLYWLLFVTERAYALQQHRPLTLHSTIDLPKLGDDPSDTVELTGFLHLVNLFRPFDDTFIGLWNKSRRTGCTTEWLAHLQQQLTDSLPTYLHLTETQAVDLRCSRQWLHTMVWQLSISQGFLSSAAEDGAMSLKFPIEIARDLVAATSNFSKQAMEVHGIGLIEKLFDVACTLTDVMACVPPDPPSTQFALGPRDYLDQLMKLIASLRGGRQRFTPLLLAKISDTLPSLPSSIGSTIGYSPNGITPPPPALPLPPAPPSSARIPQGIEREDSFDDPRFSHPRPGIGSASTSGSSTPYGPGSISPPPPPNTLMGPAARIAGRSVLDIPASHSVSSMASAMFSPPPPPLVSSAPSLTPISAMQNVGFRNDAQMLGSEELSFDPFALGFGNERFSGTG